ncbi:MAG: histidinol dehydrogenase [Alphaproteobacteria bacterium]|nr:histidinol dehydrogenase [Alphaproteobacteria bacterium]
MAQFLKHGIDADTKMKTDQKIRAIVEEIIAELEARGDEAVRHYSKKFDD